MASSKYQWPLPGEAVTAKELFAAELRAAFPGLATYSEDGRTYAALAEFMAQYFNGFPSSLSPTFAALSLTAGPLSIGGGLPNAVDLSSGRGNITYGATSLNISGGAAATPSGLLTVVQVNDGSSFAMNLPSPTPASGVRILIAISNGFGTLGTITWNGNYKFVGGVAPTNPSSAGKTRLVEFVSFGSVLLELYRSSGDI